MGELVVDVRRLLAMVRWAYPGWDWALTMNPETFAVLDTPVQPVESAYPASGARYTAPALWGAELVVVQLVHEVVICAPVGSLHQTGPWPVTYYLDLGTRVVGTTPPTVS